MSSVSDEGLKGGNVGPVVEMWVVVSLCCLDNKWIYEGQTSVRRTVT